MAALRSNEAASRALERVRTVLVDRAPKRAEVSARIQEAEFEELGRTIFPFLSRVQRVSHCCQEEEKKSARGSACILTRTTQLKRINFSSYP